MGNDVVLELKDISKSFPGVQALDGVSLTVRKGEAHVVIGENGAGKSTLMKIISGVYPNEKGSMYLEGEPVNIKSVHEAQELGISIIHQELNLLPYRTVAQNIFLGKEPIKNKMLHTIDENQINRKSREILNSLGIELDPETLVKNLGIAQQQMLEVAKALVFKSKVLIMDEPTATLTKREIDKLFEIIFNLKKDGVAIIYISHRLEELKQIADTISVMRDGKLVGTYKQEDISIDEMIKLMVGREIQNQYKRDYNEPGEVVLRAENISSYRFSDVSFHVRRGEIVGLSGLVGAGRTEVCKAIFGYDLLEAGSVYINGKTYKKITPKLAKNAGIGLIPENRKEEGLILTMPVMNNIVQANLRKIFRWFIKKSIEKNIAEKYKKELRIATPSVEKMVMYLSGGNQQKVVLAKWLCTEGDIFIFDEPTRGIDVGAKAEIYEILNNLAGQGKAILIVSSDMPEILGLCDRIYTLKDGRITAEFSKQEATQEKMLSCSI
ncbi:MAG TPA: sugar ABC transporter ATP-binding protein [Bacillota bacterium]|nr:sugar ABC transporter ATP-binding protein [Bacillota bacterium]